mmetsp:Transcript_38072/g.108135  ORF Transcript_38072/g.108135 Transcript_38072/m.108135 type:complete len:408 (-) Transcript_38072:117-1340(-)
MAPSEAEHLPLLLVGGLHLLRLAPPQGVRRQHRADELLEPLAGGEELVRLQEALELVVRDLPPEGQGDLAHVLHPFGKVGLDGVALIVDDLRQRVAHAELTRAAAEHWVAEVDAAVPQGPRHDAGAVVLQRVGVGRDVLAHVAVHVCLQRRVREVHVCGPRGAHVPRHEHTPAGTLVELQREAKQKAWRNRGQQLVNVLFVSRAIERRAARLAQGPTPHERRLGEEVCALLREPLAVLEGGELLGQAVPAHPEDAPQLLGHLLEDAGDLGALVHQPRGILRRNLAPPTADELQGLLQRRVALVDQLRRGLLGQVPIVEGLPASELLLDERLRLHCLWHERLLDEVAPSQDGQQPEDDQGDAAPLRALATPVLPRRPGRLPKRSGRLLKRRVLPLRRCCGHRRPRAHD